MKLYASHTDAAVLCVCALHARYHIHCSVIVPVRSSQEQHMSLAAERLVVTAVGHASLGHVSAANLFMSEILKPVTCHHC